MPLPVTEAPCYVLVETSGWNGEHDQAKLETYLECCLAGPGVSDGVVATETARMASLLQLRKRIPEVLLKEGYVFK